MRSLAGEPAELGIDVLSQIVPELVDAALFHRIAPVLHAFLDPGGQVQDPEQRDRLTAAYDEQVIRHVATISAVATVGRVCRSVGTAWAVLKGPVLAEVSWPRPELRTYYDLDILIPAASLPAVLAGLLGAGCTVPPQPWRGMRRHRVAQLTVRLPSGVLCDLHWELLAQGTERKAFRFSTPALLARSEVRALGSTTAPVLASDDAFVHTCVHASLAGATRLVWFADIALLARSTSNWTGVVEAARSARAGLVTAAMLHRAGSVLDPRCPPPVRAALTGRSAWGSVLGRLDDTRPVEQAFGRRGSGRLLYAATRASTVESMTTAVRAAVPAARWLLRTPPPGPDQHGWPEPSDRRAAEDLARTAAGSSV